MILDDRSSFTTTDYVELTVRLLDSVTGSYSIDTNRLYVTGQSMGGMTFLLLSAKYPNLFAAALFVSCQWDISTLGNLASQTFFYIAAEGDAKASGGQVEVKDMLSNAGVSYSTAVWNATWSSDEFDTAVTNILAEGNNINIATFELGTVLPEGVEVGTNEHMYSFDYAYKIEGVRDWLFEQTNAQIDTSSETTETTAETTPDNTDAKFLTFNNSAWNYDADNNVYWQIGVQYAANPETLDYETMGIYVPGAYMTATDNGDGTYTAALNPEGAVNGYTAQTAPIVLPVNTPGYSAQAAPTSYSYNGISSYLEAGFIYVHAGMRGRSNGYDDSGNLIYSGGAPWGITDMKAAIRYYRYNQNILPGDVDSMFTFGMSGGGAQSVLVGATGDSELYFVYLESIGAAMYDANGEYISDAIKGTMAWCPITSLDYADEAYEWNMGQYTSTGTRADDTWTSVLSDDLSKAYAEYLNELGLIDANGNVLVLQASEDGIYAVGSYYDYLLGVVEESLNNFLADTEFPYTETAGGFMGGGFPNDGIQRDEGGTPPEGGTPEMGMSEAESTTYETVQDYIDALNTEVEWVTYTRPIQLPLPVLQTL